MRRHLLLLCAVLLAACSSVPVSTMWKFASFDRGKLLAIDSDQLRAATLIDRRATMKNVTIKITLTPKDGAPVPYDITLGAPAAGDQGLPAAPPQRRWEVFALSLEGRQAFVRMREAVSRMPAGSSMQIAVSAREGDVPPELLRAFPLRIDMKFDDKDGWFTLLADGKLDLEAMAKKA